MSLSDIDKGDILVRVLFRENPDTLDDEAWAQRVEGARFFFETLGGCLFNQQEADQKQP